MDSNQLAWPKPWCTCDSTLLTNLVNRAGSSAAVRLLVHRPRVSAQLRVLHQGGRHCRHRSRSYHHCTRRPEPRGAWSMQHARSVAAAAWHEVEPRMKRHSLCRCNSSAECRSACALQKVPLPELPAHAKYVHHRNECYDWGTYGWLLLRSGMVDITVYKYFFFVNSSVRGPFLPAYARVSHISELSCKQQHSMRAA